MGIPLNKQLLILIVIGVLSFGAWTPVSAQIDDAWFDGRIDDNNQAVSFSLPLEAGVSVLIQTEATSGNLDTILRLFTPDGIEVAFNDDGNDGTLNSIVGLTVAESGDYTVIVGRYWGDKSEGAFRLHVVYGDESLIVGLGGPVILSGSIDTVQTEHFIIHFTENGYDRADIAYAKDAALILEEMLEKQLAMGWGMPPTNSSGLIPVYIAELLNEGIMGYTSSTGLLGDNPDTPRLESRTSTSVMALDNDFNGIEEDALGLLRTTATHELNHALQSGYDPDDPLYWYYEATAAWMETATAGDDEDATGYVGLNFSNPFLCLGSEDYSGLLLYGDWTFMQSLEDQFGAGAVVRLWETIAEEDGLTALDVMTETEGSDLLDTVATWRVQNLARDYALAPLFGRAVALEDVIRAQGEYAYRGVQGLGVQYIEIDLAPGFYTVSLAADEYGLLAYAIGVRGNDIVAGEVGKEAVIDTHGYDHVYVMVFNMRYDELLADCRGMGYTLRVKTGGDAPIALDWRRFSAEHFLAPG